MSLHEYLCTILRLLRQLRLITPSEDSLKYSLSRPVEPPHSSCMILLTSRSGNSEAYRILFLKDTGCSGNSKIAVRQLKG